MAEAKYKRLLSNTAIVAMGTLGSKLLMYLLVRFYTEVLSSGEYSLASNIAETATLLIPIVSLGLGEAVFRLGMDRSLEKKSVFSSALALILMGLAALAVFSPAIGLVPYFSGYEWLICVYVASSILHTLCSQFIRAQNMFTLFAVQGILNSLFTVLYNLLFLLVFDMGATGYVLSVAAADLSATVFIAVFARLHRFVDIKAVSKSVFKGLLVYSLPLIPTTISWWVTNVSDRYMVTYFKGDSANGLYAVAYKIPTLLTVLVGIFNNAWKYSAVDEKGNKDETAFVSNVSEAFISVIFVASAAVALLSKPISAVMLAREYSSAFVYIPILTAAMLFSSLASFSGTVFISQKKSMYSLVTTVIPAAINVILNLILIPLFDGEIAAMGAAIATLVSYALMYILKAFASRRLLRYNAFPIKVLINSSLLLSLCALVSLDRTFSLPLAILLAVAMVAFNMRSLMKTAKLFLKR